MDSIQSEKARLLEKLREGRFNVPDFIFVPASDFERESSKELEAFLLKHQESFKIIVRSAHPNEGAYKSGTFDSIETYSDLKGVIYARNRIITLAKTANRLSILRQQKFDNAISLNLDDMGIVVMPFVYGTSVMAKKISNKWEFGYCRDRTHKVQSEPFITDTPHDRKLLKLSEDIQDYLGFKCEIEFIVSNEGEVYVVQAKDISNFETLDEELGVTTKSKNPDWSNEMKFIRLDGIRRIRKRRNFRARHIYVMDTKIFYMNIIDKCEDMVHSMNGPKTKFEDIIDIIKYSEAELEAFALKHKRFAVIGLSIGAPDDLFQIANHYLDDTPAQQKRLSQELHSNLYKRDQFLSEADTLIARDKIRINLCSHDAYGIDTVLNPMWSVYWNVDKTEQILKEFRMLKFKTGDLIGLQIDNDGKPVIFKTSHLN